MADYTMTTTIERGYDDTVAAVRDALLAAAEDDPYFRKPADNLAKGSPTAAHVTFEYLRRARQMSIEQVLALDLVMARRFQRLHDFGEGVRALLIDKDKNPRWAYPDVASVTTSYIDGFFLPLWSSDDHPLAEL